MLQIRIRDANSPTYEGVVMVIESDLSMELVTGHKSVGGIFWLHRLSLPELEYIAKTINDYLKEVT